MRGKCLAAAARCVAREDTFERAIAPAIADLQHESPSGRVAALDAYGGVLKTIAGAFALDVEQDIRLAFGLSAFRSVWTLAALALALSVASNAAIRWLGSGQDVALIALTVPVFAASMLPAVLLPAAAAFRRAGTSHRAVVSSAVVVAVITAALWLTMVPAAQRAQSAYRIAQTGASELTPLSALPAATQARVRAGIQGNREAARHAPFAFALAVVGYALLGWSFASARMALTLGVTVDLAVTQSFFANAHGASGAAAPWTPVILLTALGLLAVWVRGETDERLTLRSG